MQKLIAQLTPADKGIIAATLDDTRPQGLSDDGTYDELYSAIYGEVNLDEQEAKAIAYYYAHN